MSLSESLQIQNDITEKQNLIKQEILDQNFDKTAFFNFCLQSKPQNGDDLGNWTMSDIQEVISNFKEQIAAKKEPENISNQFNQPINQNQYGQLNQFNALSQMNQLNQLNQFNQQSNQFVPTPQMPPMDSTIQNPYANNTFQQPPQPSSPSLKERLTKTSFDQKINSQEKFSTEKVHHYTREIQCKQLEKSPLNGKKITVTIKNPKPVETGLFRSNYIVYEINTSEVNWNVTRRYSDFYWLRQMLCKFYPRNLIPPMPNKKMGSRRFEVDFVEKRMKFLEKFISNIVANESFKSNEALISFLYVQDRNQFEFKMKEISAYNPSNYISETKTLTGKLTLSSDADQNEKYYTNIKNYFNLQTQIFDRLNYNLKDFYNYMNLAIKQLEDVEKDFEMLNILNSRVQMKEEVTKTYEELTIFFKNWKRMLFNQNEIIKSNIKDFFKYIKMEGNSYEELINSREEAKKKFQSESTRLKGKKDKLWATMDISKWEITEDMNKIDGVLLFRDRDYAYAKMCTKESLEVENLRMQLDYANKTNIDELRSLISRYSINFYKNIKDFTNALYPSLNDGLTIWSGLNSFAQIAE